jgi:CheY-like chemotaxis protein
VEQVLLNLALNGRDAMPSGGRLVVSTAMAELGSGAHPGRWACLRVADTGEGMSPEVAERVFEPFFTTKEVGKGSGLGLSMVHGVAHQSGGWVEVESAPGRGSTFSVYLPWRDTAALPAPESRGEPPAATAGETVLVAEDEALVRRLTVRALEAYGYRVLAAGTATEALAQAETAQRLDLLVSDVVLPDLRGPQLRERLLALRPGVPVLFVSGYADRDLAGVTDGDGVAFLQKPFSPAALAERVRALLAAAGGTGRAARDGVES